MNFVRKTARVYPLLGLLALISILAGCSKAVPQDGAPAKMTRFDGLNNLRYCEYFSHRRKSHYERLAGSRL